MSVGELERMERDKEEERVEEEKRREKRRSGRSTEGKRYKEKEDERRRGLYEYCRVGNNGKR